MAAVLYATFMYSKPEPVAQKDSERGFETQRLELVSDDEEEQEYSDKPVQR
jgi:hypothetical protein